MFDIPFKALKVGMFRKTTRVLPLKHGLPFIPKTSPGLNTFTIDTVSKNHLCVHNTAHIVFLGVITNLKICISQVSPGKCEMNVFINIEFTGKGTPLFIIIR